MEMEKKRGVLKTIYSVGTGNWFATGENTGQKDLERLCRLHPFSTYELCEVDFLTNSTGVYIHVLGEALGVLCVDDKGNRWERPVG